MKLKRMKCMDCAFEFYYDPEIIVNADDDGFLCPSCNVCILRDDEIVTSYELSEVTEIDEIEFSDRSDLDKSVINDIIFKLNTLMGVPADGDIDYDKISLLGSTEEQVNILVEILHKLENL